MNHSVLKPLLESASEYLEERPPKTDEEILAEEQEYLEGLANRTGACLVTGGTHG